MRSLCITLCLLLISAVTFAETLRFTSIEYCPFTCDPALHDGKEGIMTDVLRAAFEEQGYELEIDIMPYARAVQFVRDGVYDGIVVVGKYFAPNLIYPEIPTLTQRMMFMVKPTHTWRYKGYDSLSEVSIAVIKGFDYADREINQYVIDNKGKNNLVTIHGDNTTERGLMMLQTDRVDTYIEGQLTALYHIAKDNLHGEYIVAGFSADEFEDFTGFSPHSIHADRLADLLTNKIAELKANGTLSMMLSRYGIEMQL